ncbi:hypothetical protein BGM26_07570 [Bacillus sp. FJAT-29790]|uniref:hypothetical protein n=1 Tax=Bacillus sp. FJAT-29790 TaxID=1895002 RepID=UPI001C22C5C9|nr:hypothetical protein [Bacillus sp. FJAT-29790]
MNFSKLLLPFSILLIFLVGCNNDYISSATSNPTLKEYFKYDNADIFLLNGYVFSNAQDVEWVTELKYELGEQVGEITKQADKASKFENGTANKLPIGTEIFKTDTPVNIAIVDGEEIPYLKMVEG